MVNSPINGHSDKRIPSVSGGLVMAVGMSFFILLPLEDTSN